MLSALRIKQRKPFFALVMAAVIFFGSLLYFSHQIRSEVTHPDEVLRVRMSRYFKLFFMDRDFKNEQWQKREIIGAPPVSAYVAGLALCLSGQQEKIGAVDIEDWWNFKKSFDWNLSNIKLPEKSELYALKFTMALFVSLSGIVIYAICLKCFGFAVALFAAWFFLSHPLMLKCATQATLDGPLVFLINLALLLMIVFYQGFSKSRVFFCLILATMLGFITAVAAGIKIQGAIAGVVFLIFCFFLMVAEGIKYFKRRDGRESHEILKAPRAWLIAASVFLFGVTAMIFFILPNPRLHERPVEKTIQMIEFRAKQIRRQIAEFSTQGYFHDEYGTVILDSFPKKMARTIERVFFFDGRSKIFSWTGFVFFAVGFCSVLSDQTKRVCRHLPISFGFIVLVWSVVIFVAVTAVLYIDFATHFFTLVAPVSILTAYGLDQMLRTGRRFFNQRIPK